MESTIIAIPDGEKITPKEKKKFQLSVRPIISHLREKKIHFPPFPIISNLKDKNSKNNMRKLIHCVKVGVALVLVSLLYLLDPLYKQVGDNAMWAIMTVIVIFEFSAGATLGKGLNRGMGTILGGGLGCSAAAVAQEIGGVGNAIIVGTLVFMFGAVATYVRLVPSIKKRYDYGVMIFLLTFNLVVVSGIRAEKIMELARDRLLTIAMGFAVCISVSFIVLPQWSSDELHDSMASKFEDLASIIEGCLKEYFEFDSEKDNEQPSGTFSACKAVLNSKSKDESLANFAKWEPWHGRFGFSYPWDRYLKTGEVLRELAAIILSLKGCLQSSRQPLTSVRQSIKEPCEEVGSSLVWTLRELGESIMKMRKCQPGSQIVSKLKTMRVELHLVISRSKIAPLENGDELAIASFLFLFKEVVEKVQELVKEVEELGEVAEFHTH
ncbi:Aluminum-activated malate transporter like [Quillaja saponaria]|uniref:Aluminum-activated malate transporter like n=1 Tax=Quillaja saponaria TaxID=32244 RepID=A0AAD7VIV5_QUISA|nr:Aluminum-activated malate transporter like [Quillaja saponaria]